MVRGFFVVLVCFFISFGLTWEASDEEKPRKFIKPCFNEDELLNVCTDPIEICHDERADEIKLVRLDGVKVSR